MNNSDFPSAHEDLHDFLTHPQHWAGTEIHLRLKDTDQTSSIHYSALLDKFFWRRTSGDFKLSDTRVGHEFIVDLVTEGWVLENAY